MKKYIIRFFSLFLFSYTFFYNTVFSQENVEKLQTERRKLVSQINRVRKNLHSVEQKTKEKSEKILMITKQIEINSLILQTIDDEISEVQREIEGKKESISLLFNDLESLKREYAKIIYIGYKATHGVDQIVYIFSSSSFNQLSERLRYVKHYAKFRKKHFEEIRKIYSLLNKEKESSEKYQLQKKDLLLIKRREVNNLIGLRKKHAKLVNDLIKNQDFLKKELQVHNEQVAKLDSLIKIVIEQSIEENRREKEKLSKEKIRKQKSKSKNEDINKKTAEKSKGELSEIKSSSQNYDNSKADSSIKNSNFAKQKGKLPWPVDNGIIVGKVGIWPHPVLKGIQIENMGMNIQTRAGNKAKSIFEGIVTNVIFVPGMQNVVIIQHGRYYTVYTRLENIVVKIGQNVTQEQVIGTVHCNESGYAEMQLQIWDGTNKVNPQHWLTRNIT